MTVWVPGGTGMLGRALCRVLATRGVAHVATGREVDLTLPADVHATMARLRPTHVINCAAFTQVDACEGVTDGRLALNAVAPGILGAAAHAAGSYACQISTDYVFDGSATAPYAEDAPTAPLGAYGRSKHAGEVAFTAAAPAGHVVRTAWLYGHGGRHFVRTMLGLMATRETLQVVADQRGGPTYCDDLAAALAALAGLADSERPVAPPGIYHAVNDGETSWHGFAQAIHAAALARGARLACREVVPVTTAEYPTPARRPAYSVLGTGRLVAALGAPLRPWQQALASYMEGWSAGRP